MPAAAWYAAAGRTELAIEHALRGDTDAVARSVTREALPALFGRHGDKLDR
jgi:ATP/maltotriose-dependent transcriptional regulator MalT